MLAADSGDPRNVEESGAFYISAPSDPWPYALKHGESFALFDERGDVIHGKGRADGIYFRDTRVLSQWRLLVDGRRPVLLSSTLRDNNSALIVDMTNREVRIGEHLVQQGETQHLVRKIFLWDSACHQRIAIYNYSQRTQRNTLRLEYRADFVDLFEVRGHVPQHRGTTSARVVSVSQVELGYTATDGLRQSTTMQFHPPPYRITENAVEWELELAPGERHMLFMRVDPSGDEAGHRHASGTTFLSALRKARKALRRTSSRATAIETSNEIFNEVVRRSIADLYMLITETEDGPYPYAGVPWYSTPFGRDGIITALEMLWVDPNVARGVLFFLARNQAMDTDPMADAEPGKILHEMRHGELARIGEVPFAHYYGSVDSTPLFVLLAGRYYKRTGDLETMKRLWPNIEAALRWIDGAGDPDGDGFLEYMSKRPDGLSNQGWKDSADAIFHADGALAEGPIALVEVQAYVYAAKLAIAEVARVLGRHADAARFIDEAEALRLNFEETFWSEELGNYALALDGEKRPCLVRASNVGHVLLSGIASEERAARVARELLTQKFFCGWGIRTIASGEPRYNPMSYHNGSVWPHDNAMIALGLAQYGDTQAVQAIFTGLFRAASFMSLRRLPELFCGFRRRPGRGPTNYPVACSPQAWAAAAPLALLQASLGLNFDVAKHAIVLHHPRLPDFLDEVLLRNLRLEKASVDLLLRRHGSDVAINVIRRDGDVAVDVRV